MITPLFLVLPGIIAYQIFGENIAHTDRAYGMLVNLVLPPALTGVFAAVMVGAILSSFNSALSGIITLFSLGVYKSFLNREAGEASILRAGKIFGWCVALSAMLLAPFLRGQESLFAYLQKMNGIYFIPLFSVVLVGLVFKRIPPLAAKAGLLGGCLLIAGGYFIPISSSAEGYVFITDYIHEFHFLGIIFLVLVVGMLVLGYYKPLAKAWEHESFAAVEMTPFRYVKAVSVVLVMIVIMLYWVFADFS